MRPTAARPGASLMSLAVVFLVVSSMLLCSACGVSNGPTVIKLAHGLDVAHPVHQAMVRMAEIVGEDSDGTVRIDIYPSEQLGSERECVELLQIGSIGMTKVSASPAEAFIPSFKIFSLPYLFRDRGHLFEVLEGEVGRDLLLDGIDQRLRGLCFFDAGSRSFYTRETPVHTPADLVGLKIRTQESATAMSMVRALGGSATPISWGELYTALQQGVVDGAENNPPSFYLSGHYEVCKYYSLDQHTWVPDVLLMSTRVWDALEPNEQALVQRAALEAAEYQKTIWAEASAKALAQVEEAGVEIIRPDKAPFQAAVEEMLEEYRDQPEIWRWIERIREVRMSAASETEAGS